MATKNFGKDILLGTRYFGDLLSLSITKGKLSKHDIKVNYKDLKDSEFWKTPKHIHWIFDIMIKKEHTKDEINAFVSFLYSKWNQLDSEFCSKELERLYMKIKTLDEIFDGIKDDLSVFKGADKYGYFPCDFLGLFGYLMILQEKNNRSDAYMFKHMLEGVINDESNPYKVISIATGKYKK